MIIKNPQLVQLLEDAADQEDGFANLCSAYTPPLASDLASLRAFFQSDPKLAAAAYHLVYVDPNVELPVIGPTMGAEPAEVASADHAVPAPAGVAPPGRRRGADALIAP